MDYYGSWPKVVSANERSLLSLAYGHLYAIEPVQDSESRSLLTLKKDGDDIGEVAIREGKVVDFTVAKNLIAVATLDPACLYICRPYKESVVLATAFPMTPTEGHRVSSITLGNYSGNIIAVWHTDDVAPVFIGMIGGRDAFRFDYKPLIYYDDSGRQRLYVRQDYERILAVPHFPGQFGTVAIISPLGVRFLSLKPYYTMNRFTDNYASTPMQMGMGWADQNPNRLPQRMQMDAYNLLVHINKNHLMMKYDPTQHIKENQKDWVRLVIDGQEVQPSDIIFTSPTTLEYPMRIEAKQNLESVELHADLPVTFRLAGQERDAELSNMYFKSMPKGTGTDILVSVIQCLTPWDVARFIEKFNIKIRAEVWS